MLRRITALLCSPRAEWARIAAESRGAASALFGWVLPLALLPFVALLLRFTLFTALFGARAGFALAPYVLGDAAAQYAFIVVWTGAVAAIAHLLAPRFGSTPDLGRAFRLVAYALTPAFLASIVIAVPSLQYVAALGLVWAVALLRFGVSPMMRAPEARATAYSVTVAVIAAVLALLALLMPSCTRFAPPDHGAGVVVALKPAQAGEATKGTGGRRTSSPDERLAGADKKGSGAINLDDLPKESIKEMIERTADPRAMKEAEEAARLAAEMAGKIPFKPAEPSALAELVPASACGQPRASLESKLGRFRTGDMADAQAVFGAPGSPVQVHLSVGDNTSAAWGLTQVRKIMPNRNRTTDRGYERFRTDGDYFFDERWNNRSREARYSVLIASRFVVTVVATGIETPECAEQAARSVDWAALAAMASSPAK